MKIPQKVMVIGSGGSGKSTLSVKLSNILGLELIALDQYYWNPGWVETAPSEWEHIIYTLIKRPCWVMDGNYGGTMDIRLEEADTVIFLYFPSWVCLRREIFRTLRYLGRVRPGMVEGCPTRVSLEFWKYIWWYNKTRAPGILKKLDNLRNKQVFILRSDSEVTGFLSKLKNLC